MEPDRSGLARELFNTVKNYLLARQAKAMGLEPKDEGTLWETPPEKSLIVSLTIGKVLEEEPEPELTREEIVDFYRSHPMYHGLKFEAAREKVVTRLTSEKRRANAIDRLRDRFGVKILVD